jgi:ABC-type branched-subunit amino acid transport system permease subunit
MHRLTGYIALAAALLMDFAGYYMGRFSKLKNFDNFVIGFASPWVLIAIGVLVTAKFLKYYKWH